MSYDLTGLTTTRFRPVVIENQVHATSEFVCPYEHTAYPNGEMREEKYSYSGMTRWMDESLAEGPWLGMNNGRE